MGRRPIVGVMGPGAGATPVDLRHAEELGSLIAREGWIVLSGGRAEGVMDAVCRGAQRAGGLTVGVLPDDDDAGASDAVDIAIVTGLGSARNNIIVLSSQAVVACGIGAGTASEVALAIKAGKPVVLLGAGPEAAALFGKLGGPLVRVAENPTAAVALLKGALADPCFTPGSSARDRPRG
jgi:hypothetical protein